MLFILLSIYISSLPFVQSKFSKLYRESGAEDTIEAIIVLREKPEWESVSNLTRREKLHYLIDFTERTQSPIVDTLLRMRGIVELHRFFIINGFYLRAEKRVFKQILKNPKIDAIYANDTIWIEDAKVEIGKSGRPYGIHLIGADSVWYNLGITGENIVVGTIDTGVDADHPALASKYLGYFFDAVNGHTTPYDDHGHGTHTMGTILGGDGPGDAFDETHDIGVAPGALFVTAKAFSSNGAGSTYNILRCFDYMASLIDSGVDLRIVSNSWGSNYSQNTYFFEATLDWRELGIIPVFSIGNNGPSGGTAGIPGNYPTVIGVGAINSDMEVAQFSSRGPSPQMEPWSNPIFWPRADWNFVKPDISAPGVDVFSSLPSSNYGYMSGTSMAAPHVAGAIALILEVYPELDFKDIYMLLTEKSTKLLGHSYPNNNEGFGIINVYKVLKPAEVNVTIRFPYPDNLIEGKSAQLLFDASSADTISSVELYFSIDDTAFPDSPLVTRFYESPDVHDTLIFTLESPPTSHGALLLKAYSVLGAEGMDTLYPVVVELGPPSALTGETGYPYERVRISWQDGSQFDEGYEVERSVDEGNYEPITILDSSLREFEDTTVEPFRIYRYRVRSYYSGYRSRWRDIFIPTMDWFVSTAEPSISIEGDGRILYPMNDKLILLKFSKFGEIEEVDTLVEGMCIDEVRIVHNFYVLKEWGGKYIESLSSDGKIDTLFDGGTNWRVIDFSVSSRSDTIFYALITKTVHLPFLYSVLLGCKAGENTAFDTLLFTSEPYTKISVTDGGAQRIALLDSLGYIHMWLKKSEWQQDTVFTISAQDLKLIEVSCIPYLLYLEDSIVHINKFDGHWYEDEVIYETTGELLPFKVGNELYVPIVKERDVKILKCSQRGVEDVTAYRTPAHPVAFATYSNEGPLILNRIYSIERLGNTYLIRVNSLGKRFMRRTIGGVLGGKEILQKSIIKAYPIPSGDRVYFSGYSNGGVLKVYRSDGSVIRIFHIGRGWFDIRWNLIEGGGSALPNGVYLYKLEEEGTSIGGKLVILR